MAVSVFSYNPQLVSHLDWVRFYVGDVREERAELSDLEIEALLDEEDDPDPFSGETEPTASQWRSFRQTVASRAAGAVAARYAREADVSFDNQRVAMSAKFHQYRQLADRLKSDAQSGAGGTVWVQRV